MPPDSESVHLVTFVVPSSSAEPMEVKVAHSGLRMVLVSRESISLLDETWRVLGVYFLLGAADDPDRYRAYVGEVGKSTLVQRVKQHAAKKDWWGRALLIASSSDEFNSAEIGWLEGRLYDVLNNAVACEVMNGNRPGDDSLSLRERGVLERYVEPIMAALRACGASPDTADQKPVTKGRTHTVYTETVADLVKAGLLKPETQLHPLRKGLTQTATVLADGRLQVGSVIHDSLSGAAKAVAGTTSEAGWNFWGAPSGAGGFVPLATLRDRLRTDGSATSAPPKKAAAEPSEDSPIEAQAATRNTSPVLASLAKEHSELFPLKLQGSYRGSDIEAVVKASGEIIFDGQSYTSPSAAANAARLANGFSGPGDIATNGWVFWRFTDADGVVKALGELRHRASSD